LWDANRAGLEREGLEAVRPWGTTNHLKRGGGIVLL